MWNSIPRSEVNEAIHVRVNHILDMVLTEADHSDDGSSKSRNSFENGENIPVDDQVHKAGVEKALAELQKMHDKP